MNINKRNQIISNNSFINYKVHFCPTLFGRLLNNIYSFLKETK